MNSETTTPTTVKAQISAAWDFWSQSYDGAHTYGLGSADEKDAWLTALRELVGPAPLRIAEVGSGTGQISLLLAELGHEVRGFDLSEGMLDLSRQKAQAAGLPVQFLTGDAEALPLADGEVDLLINRMVFWILRQPVTALREWRRVVKPGGRIIVIDGLWGQSITLRQKLKFFAAELFYLRERLEARRHQEQTYRYRRQFRALDKAAPGMQWQHHEEVLTLFVEAGLTQTALTFLPAVDAARRQRRRGLWRWLDQQPFFVITAQV